MIDMRRLSDDLTDAFIGYQHRLDNPFPSSTETEAMVTEKYRNDPVFHAKVRSLVVGVMDIVSRNVAAKGETAQPQVPDGWVPVPIELVQFLNGTGELEGMDFGSYPSPSEGDFTKKYWWRKYLPKVPDGTISAAKEEGK